MNTEELILLIKEVDDVEQVLVVEGVHGIGKTQCIGQGAKELGLHLEPLILSLMDTGDVIGMPDTDVVGGLKRTTWAAPDWFVNVINKAWPEKLDAKALIFNDKGFEEYYLSQSVYSPTREVLNNLYTSYYELPEGYLHIAAQDNVQYSKGVRSMVFLDEFNRASPDIQDAGLQFLAEKRLHSHVLPRVMGKETLIVGAVNPAGGNYNVNDFDPALLDRMVYVTLNVDLKSWKIWAKPKGVHPVVIEFLTNHPDRFHMTPESGKGTSPRTWEKYSDYLHKAEKKGNTNVMNYSMGRLGTSVGIEMATFYSKYGNTTSVEQLEKLICTDLKTYGSNADVVEIAENIQELVSKLDNTQKLDYVEHFKSYYLINENSDVRPLLVYLYTLPLEVLATVMKAVKKDIPKYKILIGADKAYNDNGLVKKLTRHLSHD